MSAAEYIGAQRDVLRTMQCYGSQIKLFKGKEENVERDEYGSIIDYSPEFDELYSFPVEFSPSNKVLEKLGIRETVDVVFYLSKMELNDKLIPYSDIGIDTIRRIIVFQDVEYKIKAKNQFSQFGNDFLYVVVGAMRN